MKPTVLTAVAVGICLVALQCTGHRKTSGDPVSPLKEAGSHAAVEQTPAQQYAGELLSYLMQVVLGKAGNPGSRKEWQTKALYEPLDFEVIVGIMDDPEKRMSDLMVFDANILGLSSVLYHYNPRLNFYKGETYQESVYPSAELLAIRLLLVKKIARGEKVRLGALVAREEWLNKPQADLAEAVLAATNLNREELKLLQNVIRSEPAFRAYLQDPFMVESLYRLGVVEPDMYVKAKIAEADYADFESDGLNKRNEKSVFRVAILPSMIRDFDFQPENGPGFPKGFRATSVYKQATLALKNLLKEMVRRKVAANMTESDNHSFTPEIRDAAAGVFVDRHIEIVDLDERPLVVYPENADRMIRSICPAVDFSFIILGKDVYLSIYIDEQRDIFPYTDRMYLDVMDIHRSQADYEIEQAADHIFRELAPYLAHSS